MFSSHRICPTCEGAFEVDPQTKKRQAAFIALAMPSLILTILMYFEFRQWAPFAVFSYLVLGVLIYFANRKVYLVKVEPTRSAPGEQ